jgi:D-beta-D-heptose 7-phosphate kinase/D-beta-D-heptose 1-phosphate adenosyltransferase
MKRVVVNGTFDILHSGHLALLNHARSLGDHLTVAIDSDRRVKELKGPTRPVNNEYERQEMLRNLRAVDEVKIFDTDQDLIDIISSADILVKGSDYQDQSVIGKTHAKQLIFFDRLNGYSTTKKIQDIINR